jgi:Skp family chaperone for outer membrane proteins
MRETILKEINQVIQYEARKAGYTYIFDKSGNTLNGVPGLVFSEDSTDISDQIIKILNKSKP